jgi:methyl-accepting chemotaxis protein
MTRLEEKMLKNMETLKGSQEELQRKEAEISGILNATNSSSLVAEYNLNGRFSYINEKFLLLLGSTLDSVTGKHHSDYAVVDKYSEEYNLFWQNLKEGKTVSTTELFRLFNGQELWLNHTYTPIPDKNNKPYKILNIAYDITQNKKQSEFLLNQANEIVRKNLEMEILSKAIDTSLLKAELTPDAVLLNVNEKYSESTGYSAKETLGKSIRLFLKDIEKQQFEKIWDDLKKDKSYSGVIRRTKPGGEEVWLMSSFNSVKDEAGNIYKIYFLALDITEKILKDQLLADTNLEIENLKRLLRKDPENK